MEFKDSPVVVTPFDSLVQKAVQELGPALKNVDVIKLENSCPSGKAGWVTNQDLIKGRPGKQRVIHLCLRDIKNSFQRMYQNEYKMTDPEDQRKMTDLVKTYIRDVVIPHETEHIHQEMQYGGQFGPSSEPGAEKAENWRALEQMGIRKRMAHKVIQEYYKNFRQKESTMLDVYLNVAKAIDNIASSLDKKGFAKETFELDVISNTIEKIADTDEKEKYYEELSKEYNPILRKILAEKLLPLLNNKVGKYIEYMKSKLDEVISSLKKKPANIEVAIKNADIAQQFIDDTYSDDLDKWRDKTFKDIRADIIGSMSFKNNDEKDKYFEDIKKEYTSMFITFYLSNHIETVKKKFSDLKFVSSDIKELKDCLTGEPVNVEFAIKYAERSVRYIDDWGEEVMKKLSS